MPFYNFIYEVGAGLCSAVSQQGCWHDLWPRCGQEMNEIHPYFKLQLKTNKQTVLRPIRVTCFPHTWHVALCFATLDPFATLISPVVLVGQDHIHVHVIVDWWIQTTDVEAQEREHPPEQTHKGTMIYTHVSREIRGDEWINKKKNKAKANFFSL